MIPFILLVKQGRPVSCCIFQYIVFHLGSVKVLRDGGTFSCASCNSGNCEWSVSRVSFKPSLFPKRRLIGSKSTLDDIMTGKIHGKFALQDLY